METKLTFFAETCNTMIGGWLTKNDLWRLERGDNMLKQKSKPLMTKGLLVFCTRSGT